MKTNLKNRPPKQYKLTLLSSTHVSPEFFVTIVATMLSLYCLHFPVSNGY
jgi:hypothetical protein